MMVRRVRRGSRSRGRTTHGLSAYRIRSTVWPARCGWVMLHLSSSTIWKSTHSTKGSQQEEELVWVGRVGGEGWGWRGGDKWWTATMSRSSRVPGYLGMQGIRKSTVMW